MGEVVRWARHVRHNCAAHHEDGGMSCMYCAGGLFTCTVCGGAEGSLPTDCPGRRMDESEERAVYAGTLDYLVSEGGWTLRPSRHSPAHRPDGELA